MNKIVTLFPKYRDYHFFKDPGQIAYRLSNAGYESRIVCYKNEREYGNTKKLVRINTIPKTLLSKKFNLGIISFLALNSRKFDVLIMFHLKWESLFFAFLYKLFNSKGFVYIKMDNCHFSGVYPWEKIFNSNKKPSQFYPLADSYLEGVRNFLIKKYFIYKVNLWSVEDEGSREFFEKNYPFFKNKIVTVYNGHTIDLNEDITIRSFGEKDNIILSVGRLGTFQKATDVLFQSFRLISDKCDWNLHLAGTIEDEFIKYIDDFFMKYPYLKYRITIHGPLEKRALNELYSRSKIFCLPSRFEAFAIVFSEALYFGNVIITTPYTSFKDIVIDEEIGLLVEKEDVKGLAKAILEITENSLLCENYFNNAQKFAKESLNWDKIISKLSSEINKRK